MIVRLDQQQERQFLALLEQHPFLGSRIRTAYMCYGGHSPLAAFYLVSQEAAVAVQGNSALVAGQADPEELGLFLSLCGVHTIKTTGNPVRGYTSVVRFLMEKVPEDKWADDANIFWPEGYGLEEKPDLWKLGHSGLLPDGESYYSDALRRRTKGLADILAITHQGQYVSTAGVYSIQPQGGYITAVATLPEYRNKGLAGNLLRFLVRKYHNQALWLLCEPGLKKYYAQLGFERQHAAYEFVAEPHR